MEELVVVEPRHYASRTGDRTKMQLVASIIAVGFLLVGLLGFVPGVTTNYDQLEFAGHESGAMLLGIFEVSILHNVVHLLFGVVGLLMARSWTAARAYLIGGGLIYLALLVYGLLVDHGSDANFVPLNDADNWLHLGLGVAMTGLGLALSAERHNPRTVDVRGDRERTTSRWDPNA